MNTQTAVEQKTTQYPSANPGKGEPAGGTVPEPTVPGPERPGGAVQRLKSERVQEELKAMPAWQLAHEKAIESVKTFPTPEVAALYAAYAARYGTAAGYSVTVSISGGQVCVSVYAQETDVCLGELSLPVLAFARQL